MVGRRMGVFHGSLLSKLGGYEGQGGLGAWSKGRLCVSQGNVVAGCDLLSGRLRRGAAIRILRRGGECVREVSAQQKAAFSIRL